MYTIADMLIGIKNAQAVRKEHVLVPFSEMKQEIVLILKAKGLITDFEKKKKKAKKFEHDFIQITLKYEDNEGALKGLKIISKPSRRMYIKASEIRPIRSGYGLAIISTPKGVMSSDEAKKQKLGGEIICEVW